MEQWERNPAFDKLTLFCLTHSEPMKSLPWKKAQNLPHLGCIQSSVFKTCWRAAQGTKLHQFHGCKKHDTFVSAAWTFDEWLGEEDEKGTF